MASTFGCLGAFPGSQRSLFCCGVHNEAPTEGSFQAVPKQGSKLLLNENDSNRLIAIKDSDDRWEIEKRTELELQDLEFLGAYQLEKDSVYGSVIAMPQIGRSLGWPWTFRALVFRAWLLLAVNYVLQGGAIMFIAQESQVMDVFSGKVHLCDFAYDLEDCPDGNHCTGPGGTKYTGSGRMSFDVWSIRSYMRDMVKASVKGTRHEHLVNKANQIFYPGEFGMENYYCRLVACCIFMIAEVREFFKTCELIGVLWKTPNFGESWVTKVSEEECPNWQEDPISRLRFTTAGMPIWWKVIYFFTIVVPKSLLLYNVCWMGLRFLMESAGIVEQVLGAMTMDFILDIDEMLFDALGSEATKRIMGDLEGFANPEYNAGDHDDHVENARNGNFSAIRWGAAKLCIPRRLLYTMAALLIFEARYYMLNCDHVDGMWVSKPMYLPKSVYYTFVHFVTGKIAFEGTPFWTMPTEDL